MFLLSVFSIKIFITIIALVYPFLFWPKERLERLLSIDTNSKLIFRLYGFAMSALTVAYVSGAVTAWTGSFPWGIVFMGIVSNLGAGATLFILGSTRKNKQQGLIFSAIGIGFLISALLPEFSMIPLS